MKSERFPVFTNWLNRYYRQQRPGILFENSVISQISTNGRSVYLVDDLAFPPPEVKREEAIVAREEAIYVRYPLNGFSGRINAPGIVAREEAIYVRYPQQLADALKVNRLQAYDLFNGKLRWELGGVGKTFGELADSFFLSAPLSVENRLYVLNQKNEEIRLVTLEWATGTVVATKPLGIVARRLLDDPERRIRAANLSLGRGIFVCSTNAGAVVGIDLLTSTVAWAHVYREGKTPPFWLGTAPLVMDDKVILAAVDSLSIDCLNVRDGSRLWSVPRAVSDLYVGAVADGKVIVVGSRTCRALDLDMGTELWKVDAGLPSGLGAFSQGVFYLPLKAEATTGKPEVCAIELAGGKVRAHIRSRKGGMPGNLVFAHDVLLSQTTHEIAAYSDQAGKFEQVDQRLKQNPTDPIALSERSELRLDQGDLVGAVEDLRTTLAVKLETSDRLRFQQRLFESLSELLQRDYKKGEKYLADYRALGHVEIPADLPAETAKEREKELKQRQAQSLMVIGRGQRTAGKVVDALDTYLELAGQEAGDLVPAPDDPALRVSLPVWAQGRIQELLAVKNDKVRRQLEEAIDKRWKVVGDRKDVPGLRAIAETFGTAPRGREARLLLAQQLIKDREFTAALGQLEILRHQKADLPLAGRAVLALAEMFTERGRFREAVSYYEILKRDFSKIKVHEGKTGAELYEELTTDKRFLPFLEGEAIPNGKLKELDKPKKSV